MLPDVIWYTSLFVVVSLIFATGFAIGRYYTFKEMDRGVSGDLVMVTEEEIDGGQTHMFLELDPDETPKEIEKCEFVSFRVVSRR